MKPGQRVIRFAAVTTWLVGALVGTEASARAQAASATLLWFDADPWVNDDARWFGGARLSDWTSRPTGPFGSLTVVVERFDPGTGLTDPASRPAPAPPPGARFALVNQYAPDISTFLLEDSASAPGDLDGNALPDDWERRHFGRTRVRADDDPDGDGFTNLAEFEAGTDPNSAASQPAIPDLIAFWPGEDDARDIRNAHDGVWVGAERYAEGRLGRAFAFDGTSYVRVPDAPALRPATALTVAAWVKLSEVTCDLTPILVRPGTNPGQPGFGLAFNCQGPRVQLGTPFATFNNGPISPPQPNVWYHLAATWDGTDLRFYVDGRLVFGSRVPGGLGPLDLPPGRDLLLGHDGHTRFAHASVDEVVLAGRALSAEEIRWLAGGNGGRRGSIADSTLLIETADQAVWRIERDGTAASLLTRGFDARLSPDRRWLAFRRQQTVPGGPPAERYWTRDLITGLESPGFNLDLGRSWESYDWAADGRAFVVANRSSRRIERHEMLTDARTLLVDTAPFPGDALDLTAHRTDGLLAWYFAAFDRTAAGPWTAEADGAAPQSIPGTTGPDFPSRYRLPAWSPVDDRLAMLSGPNLVSIHRDGTGRVVLTRFTGQGGEPTFVDVPPAWTADGQHVAALAVYGGNAADPRVLFVAADGSGPVAEFRFPGAPPARIVFAGGLPVTPLYEVQIVLMPPAEPGLAPQLELELPPDALDAELEATPSLGGEWRNLPAFRRERNGRVCLVVPLEFSATAQFFRLRRD